jgi:M6 family metalloprotease-like protein
MFALLVAPAVSDAATGPVPPKGGRPWPKTLIEQMQRDPQVFVFKHAWLGTVKRLKENRRAIADGRLVPASEEERLRLTALTGTLRVPVLLGKYSNTVAAPIPREDYQIELFDGPWETGTLREYFDAVSYGSLDVTGTVYDWVTTYFDDGHYAGGVSGLEQGACATDQFIVELVEANDDAVDFGQYDNDGPDNIPNSGDDDGYVDVVVTVQPETGAEFLGDHHSDNIWSHHSHLSEWGSGEYTTNDPSANGGFIKVDDYVITCAMAWGILPYEVNRIGTFCHELGHAFGLPDLYDYATDGAGCTSGNSLGVGRWCVMGWGGEEHPMHMCAWSKTELGWITPTVVAVDLPDWPIPSSTLTPTAFKLWTHGEPGTEYFLVENRTADNFDAKLPALGLLIWHVDEAVGTGWNTEEDRSLRGWNDNECHKLVDLECPDQGGADHTVNADSLDCATNYGDPGDRFVDGDAFDPSTNPSPVGYGGAMSTVEVRNIHNSGAAGCRADLIVGAPSPLGNDLCMRDCAGDPCTEPSPCERFWLSPEIYVDNNADGIGDPPATGIRNNLCCRVRNIGPEIAAEVKVRFYWAPAIMNLVVPPKVGVNFATRVIPQIAAGGSALAVVPWVIPWGGIPIPHYSLSALATNGVDPQSSNRPAEDDNVAEVCRLALYSRAGDAVPGRGPAQARSPTLAPEVAEFDTTLMIGVYNPETGSRTILIRIGSPPDYDDAVIPPDWSVEYWPTSLYLAPEDSGTVAIHVHDSYPVHTDHASVPLTAVCDGVPLGGYLLEFDIDNISPRPPCASFRVVKAPPPGGHDPGRNVITISWTDDFADLLGFPERVERWRIYRGASGDFLPGPENLLIETCLDEDPETAVYEHFADLPMDSSQVWYKILACDRAQNTSDVCTTRLQQDVTGVPEEPMAGPRTRLLEALPSPMAPPVPIRYSLSRDGDVDLAIFSVQGRMIRQLVHEWQEARGHRVVWDGRDAFGRTAPPGWYVCRLVHNGRQESRSMIILR